MGIIQVIVLAIVQGLTEFLPISSSAHLVLVPKLSNWPDQGLAFDVATHVGTLLAVMVYFRHDLLKMSVATVNTLQGKGLSFDSKMVLAVILATIPIGLVALMLSDFIEQYLRSITVIAIASIAFGILLYIADKWSRRTRDEKTINYQDALIVGLAQILALIPGTSRSGITITAGLMLGLTRSAAARFSFLLAIPTIMLAGGYEGYKLLKSPEMVNWSYIAIATAISAITAFLCIHWFLKLIEKSGMTIFVIYRILLGIGLLVIFY